MTDRIAALYTDPRIDPEYVRRLDDVTLVGVSHGHPASVYRARAIVEQLDPDTVALELPPLAVSSAGPLIDEDDEMSAAAAAADDAFVVGIDGPSIRFLYTLAATIGSDRPSLRTTKRLLHGTIDAVRDALSRTPGADRAIADGGAVGSPVQQADDERRTIDRSRALLDATIAPDSVRLRDEARESTMAAEINRYRRLGSVVAVVGLDHLDPLVERLGTNEENRHR